MEFRENNAFLTTGVYFPPQGSNEKILKNHGTETIKFMFTLLLC